MSRTATSPILVSLEGALLKSNVELENAIQLLRRRPQILLLLPLWFVRGIAHVRQMLASQVLIDVPTLPYNHKLLAYLREQHASGRELILAAAAPMSIANRIAEYLGIFHRTAPIERVLAEFGPSGFDFVAGSRSDLPLLRAAQNAILANPASMLTARVSNAVIIIEERRGLLGSLLAALRPHQWSKNILVFVPLATAHHLLDLQYLWMSLLGFVAFSFAASSVYLFNDMLDLPADRTHPRKRKRPFAAGDLPIAIGLATLATLITASVLIALSVGRPFLLVLTIYLLLTTLYSTFFKRFILLDVLVLASLYTVRVIAGTVLIGVPLSFWLLSFSMFIFLSLALVKRCSELHGLALLQTSSASGRDYNLDDLPALQAMGIASGMLAVLVIAFFIISPEITQRYSSPQILWLLCPIFLYWIGRLWLKTQRGEMHDDPIVFAIRDRTSHLVALSVLAVVLIATWAPPLFAAYLTN